MESNVDAISFAQILKVIHTSVFFKIFLLKHDINLRRLWACSDPRCDVPAEFYVRAQKKSSLNTGYRAGPTVGCLSLR